LSVAGHKVWHLLLGILAPAAIVGLMIDLLSH
jgi:hypothetical protein